MRVREEMDMAKEGRRLGSRCGGEERRSGRWDMELVVCA